MGQRRQGKPIIEQSPTVEVGDLVFVILPAPVVTIPARQGRRRAV